MNSDLKRFLNGILFLTLMAFLLSCYLAQGGYRIKTMQTDNLPGFTKGMRYLVRGGTEPNYGFKFYVTDNEGNRRILSPMHFGEKYQ